MSSKIPPGNVGVHSAFRLRETRQDGTALQEASALVEKIGRSLQSPSAFDVAGAGKDLKRASALLTGVHQGGVTVKQRPIYEETASDLGVVSQQLDEVSARQRAALQARLDQVQDQEPELFEALRSNALVTPDERRPGRCVPGPSLAALAHGPGVLPFKAEVALVRGWPPRERVLDVEVGLSQLRDFVVRPRQLQRATEAQVESNAAALAQRGLSPQTIEAAIRNLTSNRWRAAAPGEVGWPKVVGDLLQGREVVLEQTTRTMQSVPVEWGNHQVLRSVDDLLDFVKQRSAGVALEESH